MPELNDLQKAFLKNILVAKNAIIDPDTGEALDWGSISGGGVSVLLEHEPTSDLNGVSTGTSWTDLIANQNFTVGQDGSVIEFLFKSIMQAIKATAGDSHVSVKLVVDSAGTPVEKKLGGDVIQSSSFRNPLHASSVFVDGLAAGVHTVKVQIWSAATCTLYCRPTASPPEFRNIQVIEHP